MMGVAKEGVAAYSIATEGVATEGVASEGIVKEGVAANGITIEGIAVEGVAKEGVTTEGVAKVMAHRPQKAYACRPLAQERRGPFFRLRMSLRCHSLIQISRGFRIVLILG